MRRLMAVVAFVFAIGDAAAQSTSPQPASLQPVWRMDTRNLGADVALVVGCLAEKGMDDERQCLPVVHAACAEGASELALSTTAFQRQCTWRSIAAWEDVLVATRAAAHARMNAREIAAEERAHAAWLGYLHENVIARSSLYEGGSLELILAGEVRARMNGERVLELRRDLALRAD